MAITKKDVEAIKEEAIDPFKKEVIDSFINIINKHTNSLKDLEATKIDEYYKEVNWEIGNILKNNGLEYTITTSIGHREPSDYTESIYAPHTDQLVAIKKYRKKIIPCKLLISDKNKEIILELEEHLVYVDRATA